MRDALQRETGSPLVDLSGLEVPPKALEQFSCRARIGSRKQRNRFLEFGYCRLRLQGAQSDRDICFAIAATPSAHRGQEP
jgi:hypothetical protein